MSSTGENSSSPQPVKSGDCWGCRLISGCGLIGASGYIYFHARKHLRGGNPPIGAVAQIFFALGMASWGIVIIANPVGRLIPNK